MEVASPQGMNLKPVVPGWGWDFHPNMKGGTQDGNPSKNEGGEMSEA